MFKRQKDLSDQGWRVGETSMAFLTSDDDIVLHEPSPDSAAIRSSDTSKGNMSGLRRLGNNKFSEC